MLFDLTTTVTVSYGKLTLEVDNIDRYRIVDVYL